MFSKLSANGLKRKASVIATYNEISLSTDTDKGTQMGGAHISQETVAWLRKQLPDSGNSFLSQATVFLR